MKTETRIATKNVLARAGMKSKAVCSLVAILFMLALAIPAQAQLDPGSHDVFQKDRYGHWIKVGEVFAPLREPGATNYVEHWVLFDNYIYPSATAPVQTMILPSRLSYASEQDFFANVAWRPGFRYVRVDCIEATQLPGN